MTVFGTCGDFSVKGQLETVRRDLLSHMISAGAHIAQVRSDTTPRRLVGEVVRYDCGCAEWREYHDDVVLIYDLYPTGHRGRYWSMRKVVN